jgi:copper resistance protein D
MNEPLLVLVRAVHFGAALWLFGEFVLCFAILAPALKGVASNASIDPREPTQRLLRVVGWCIAIAILSACAWLLLVAANMSGTPLAAAFDRQMLLTVVRETLFGRIWMCRLALSLLLIALLFVAWRLQGRRRDLALQFVGTFLAGCYAATLAWTGHAAADIGADKYVHLTSDAVHVLAASAWVGALPGLIALLRRARDSASPAWLALAASAAQRFSALGLLTVSALVGTGLVNASYLVGSIGALPGTEYGRLLLCKLFLFALMVALAAANRLRATPQLALALAAANAGTGRGALASLLRNATLEMAGGIMIISIVSALGITMPATHMLHHSPMSPSSPATHVH